MLSVVKRTGEVHHWATAKPGLQRDRCVFKAIEPLTLAKKVSHFLMRTGPLPRDDFAIGQQLLVFDQALLVSTRVHAPAVSGAITWVVEIVENRAVYTGQEKDTPRPGEFDIQFFRV